MGIVENVRDDGFAGLEHNFLTGRLEDLVRWARRRSTWPATFGLACCAIEMMAAGGSHYDMARFGMEVFRASPRQADIMIVAGRVSQKMAPVLRTIYDQMMEPKWVISMGVCASSGGMFNNYAIVQGVDQVVPVDVYAPGCPPGPETLIQAIVTLHGKIETGEILRRREQTGNGAQVHLDEPAPEAPRPVLVTAGASTRGQFDGGATARTAPAPVEPAVAPAAPAPEAEPARSSVPPLPSSTTTDRTSSRGFFDRAGGKGTPPIPPMPPRPTAEPVEAAEPDPGPAATTSGSDAAPTVAFDASGFSEPAGPEADATDVATTDADASPDAEGAEPEATGADVTGADEADTAESEVSESEEPAPEPEQPKRAPGTFDIGDL